VKARYSQKKLKMKIVGEGETAGTTRIEQAAEEIQRNG